jgi:uncharacterized protein (TIGR00251 family)
MSVPETSDFAWLQCRSDGIELRVRVSPGARRTAIADTNGDQLRIRLAAPPVEGKANAELSKFLAQALGARASAVTIVAGDRARIKRVSIAGDPPTLAAAARQLAAST